ncbi:MAG: cofactor-independent phosphoglycerate mutase [Coriobacteriia bacterium]|nr:cofactor-independent phosphoglycerate mutase [Coriobacteriia bacterium]
MKYCVIILDGAAGWPVPDLGGRTSLQAARTPNLDAMARAGTVGLAQTVPEGTEPSSSAACMSILGYDPVADYVGRGAIEAASLGIDLGPDQVALRLNLVTLGDGIMLSYAAGHIPTEESRAIVTDLAAALDDETFQLYPGIAYRHILVVTGHPELLDAAYTPPHDISDQAVADSMPSGPGAELLLDYMERAHPVLENSAVNRCRVDGGELAVTDVWPFWPGVAPRGMVPFQTRFGKRAALTSGVDLLGGLAVLAGIDRLEIPGVSDGPDNDYAAQAQGAIEALADHDVVVIHVESPDEAGHAGDLEAKIAAIEAIDADIVSRVMALGAEVRVLAMPDHPTPVELKTHVGEPVPFVLWGAGVEANGAEAYDEANAIATGLVVDPGYGLMGLLLEE